MFEHTRKVFRKTGYTGEFGTETGSIQFAEDHSGEGFYLEIWDSFNHETQKVYLSASDILAIAQMGLITESFTTEQLLEEIPEIVRKNKEREQHLKEMAEKRTQLWHAPRMPADLEADYDAAHADLPGGDGTPEYYAVEGWGTIRLDNGDFEISYKV